MFWVEGSFGKPRATLGDPTLKRDAFTWDTKLWLGWKDDSPTQSPFCDGRVTLLAGPIFLHINTLAHPAGSTQSRWDNQSMRQRCFRQWDHMQNSMSADGEAKGNNFFLIWTLAEVDSAGRVTLLLAIAFVPYKPCLRSNNIVFRFLLLISSFEEGKKKVFLVDHAKLKGWTQKLAMIFKSH